MIDAVPEHIRPRFNRVANELIELYQLQMDALQRDPFEAQQEEYRARRRRIHELRRQLAMAPPHSCPS
jgi:hypothetical protein